MGYALLLQRGCVLGLVLQLSLRPSHLWYVPTPLFRHTRDANEKKRIDLRHVDSMVFDFALGTPFKPFEQLMGVLPAASMELIPEPYRDLMTDSNSPILDFYPTEFEQDLNGKKQDWEAVVKIPFIDEVRLLKAMACKFLLVMLRALILTTFVSSRAQIDARRTQTQQLGHKHQIHLQPR